MIRLSRLTRDFRDAGALSDLIPLYGFVDDSVFLTKAGELGLVLALDGVDYECLDPEQREAVTTRFEVALRLWDERTRLYQYVLKRNHVAPPEPSHPHPAVADILDRGAQISPERRRAPEWIGRSSGRSTSTGTTCDTRVRAGSWPTASTFVRFS